MNSLDVFILLELFTLRNLNKVSKFTLFNFRRLARNYIALSDSYDEFMSLLSTSCLSLDREVCSLLLGFKRYIKTANNVWEGKRCKYN